MKKLALAMPALLLCTGFSCISKEAIEGQRLFAGCKNAVDNSATVNNPLGQFVCDSEGSAPRKDNGRTCGTCHLPGHNFALPPAIVSQLPADDPLFFDKLGDTPKDKGLIHVITGGSGMMKAGSGEATLNELRQVPELTSLDEKCDKYGNCDSLGIFGDRTTNLGPFSQGANQNHFSLTLALVPGVDFIPFTKEEEDAIVAYMLSPLVERR